jgi:ribosome-binding factor A
MRFFRSQRVEKLIREELSKILVREFEFPNALVTITEVQVDKKLEHAKTMVSVIPSAAEESVLHTLNKSIGMIQRMLLKKINIKPMPRISFALDRGMENAARVEKDSITLLKKDGLS